MENLSNIAKNNHELYEKLLNLDCVLSKYGKVIYEGKLKDATFDDKEEGEKVVAKISGVEGKTLIFTLSENKAVNEMLDIIGDRDFNEAYKDPKTYNKLVYILNSLPVLDILESKTLENNSSTYKILYENYVISNVNEEDDTDNSIENIYEYMDQFSHELKVGDFIQFKARAVKPILYGQIQEIKEGDKPKYKIRVLGWYGDESLKSEVKKDFYEIDVNSKHIYQLNIKGQILDKLKKDGIII